MNKDLGVYDEPTLEDFILASQEKSSLQTELRIDYFCRDIVAGICDLLKIDVGPISTLGKQFLCGIIKFTYVEAVVKGHQIIAPAEYIDSFQKRNSTFLEALKQKLLEGCLEAEERHGEETDAETRVAEINKAITFDSFDIISPTPKVLFSVECVGHSTKMSDFILVEVIKELKKLGTQVQICEGCYAGAREISLICTYQNNEQLKTIYSYSYYFQQDSCMLLIKNHALFIPVFQGQNSKLRVVLHDQGEFKEITRNTAMNGDPYTRVEDKYFRA